MLLLKAPTYKMVEDNSRYADSYFYSLEAGTQNKKSLYHTMFLGYTKDTLPFYSNVGKKHTTFLETQWSRGRKDIKYFRPNL